MIYVSAKDVNHYLNNVRIGAVHYWGCLLLLLLFEQLYSRLKVMNMATSRIDMRIDETVKAAAEKAAALKGMSSLTEYVVRLI